MINLMPKIAVFSEVDALQSQAVSLAKRLNLPITKDDSTIDYALILSSEGLKLKKMAATKASPLMIDFLSGSMTYRRQHATVRREMLARALGLKQNTPVKIIDATAGLGRDSFILASLGFDVTLLERSPIIQVLLEDALKRAEADPTVSLIASRMHLVQGDAIAWLKQLTPEHRPSLIYLDPMFPERVKSAQVKKEMIIFQDIIGEDPDAEQLLETALACATQRVVIKRPRLAESLGHRKPSFSMAGSSNRFDIYLI